MPPLSCWNNSYIAVLFLIMQYQNCSLYHIAVLLNILFVFCCQRSRVSCCIRSQPSLSLLLAFLTMSLFVSCCIAHHLCHYTQVCFLLHKVTTSFASLCPRCCLSSRCLRLCFVSQLLFLLCEKWLGFSSYCADVWDIEKTCREECTCSKWKCASPTGCNVQPRFWLKLKHIRNTTLVNR